MKTEKNILGAFILNVTFSVLEFIGGALTNSVAIISDSIHDMGDAISIGLSYFLETKSKKKPDKKYTYGYIRYSILGGLITTVILIIGSSLVIYNSIIRVFNPVEINYNGMIIFAIFGVVINFMAAYLTREGDSINQKSVNLHMLEDVLGWIVVLIGAIVMRFTDISLLDPLMSILVALFILISSLKNIKEITVLFLEKIPSDIDIDELKKHLLTIKGVIDVHHIHVWSIDGVNNYATMHVVAENSSVKNKVKEEMMEHGISHTTIELESKNEKCDYDSCKIKESTPHNHHH